MRRRFVRGGLGLVLALAIVDGIFGARGLLENRTLRQRKAALAASIDVLRAENAATVEEIRQLREEPAAVEEVAREQLGLMKDGELLVILRDAPAVSASERTGAPATAER